MSGPEQLPQASEPTGAAVPVGELRALVVEDEPALAALVAQYLEREGFAVWQAATGPDGVAAALQHNPAVIILDLSLPGLDGIEVARQVRTFSDAYLMMVTARAEEVDKLIGLAVGADDYMTKPFSPRELVARVRALMRRPRSAGLAAAGLAAPEPSPLGEQNPLSDAVSSPRQTSPAGGLPPPAPGQLTVGDLSIDTQGREVFLAGRPVELTRTEFDLLAALAAHPGRVFTREGLLRSVWGPSWVGDPHAVDVHLANVRKKLGDTAQDQRYIRTVRGVGYRAGAGR
ncbi:MAG: response regulator transcription factor [Bifidobacteriaceae bacterium]|jgi:DNA-binding response OmpR family regulator|nr:response regulator transcription factor [Bifidobacteriaceae bacterium]